jgi:hypothetical protein
MPSFWEARSWPAPAPKVGRPKRDRAGVKAARKAARRSR